MQWFQRLFSRRRRYDDLAVSIEEHLDERTDELIDNGLTREDASRQARREFGNVTRIAEHSREQWQSPVLESIWADVRFALRQLRRSPGFTIVCLLTLALGIGANTAAYSILQAVILQPLPYHQPDKLVLLADRQDPQDGGILYQDYEAWREHSRSFADIAAYYRDSGWSQVTLLNGQEPESAQGAYVTANLFSLLGVRPLFGRSFTAAETNRRERVVVLSYALWQKQFGGSPDVVGQTLRIDGAPALVIGVMPTTFHFPAQDAQFWAPITTNRYWGDPALHGTPPPNVARGFYARWQAVARLKDGVSREQAQAEIGQLFHGLETSDFDPNRGSGISLLSVGEQIDGNTRLGLSVLFASACLLLLIACSNVGNLLLARGSTRSSEIALRSALGAARGRILRQLLTESLVLAQLGACVSLPIAYLGIHALIALSPPGVPRIQQAALNPGVLAFTFATAVIAAAIFGVVPAMKGWRSDPNRQWKRPGNAFTSPRSFLIVAEFVISVILLTGAGLLLHSFLLVRDVDPGFEPQHVLNIHVQFPASVSESALSSRLDAIFARLSGAPGVRAVGAIDGLFELGSTNNLGLRAIEGRAAEPRRQWTALTWDTTRGNYFQAMGAELLRGRYFSDEDGPASPLVAIIDESMARRYWPHENPLGQRFKGQDRRGSDDDWITVVGVVRDLRTHGLERGSTPHVYEWYSQAPGNRTPDIVVRVSGTPQIAAAELRNAIRDVAPTAILSEIASVQQELLHQLAPRRFETTLLALFSLLALALTSVGIYGSIHYAVLERTREIGIRMALGARRSDIVRAVLARGLSLAAIGLGIGLGAAWAATRVLARLLYGITPTDPATLSAVSLLLMAVALAACLAPALHAAKVDPARALRSE